MDASSPSKCRMGPWEVDPGPLMVDGSSGSGPWSIGVSSGLVRVTAGGRRWHGWW